MPYLLSWAVAQIKYILGQLSSLVSNITSLQSQINNGNFVIMTGSGNPEGTMVGRPGSLYVDTASGQLYKKLSGVNTSTGWSP